MKMDNKFYLLSAVIILIICFMFYWTQIRPNNIRKFCFNDSADFVRVTRKDLWGDDLRNEQNKAFKDCLNREGISE